MYIALRNAKMCTFQDQQISESNLNIGAFNSGKYKKVQKFALVFEAFERATRTLQARCARRGA